MPEPTAPTDKPSAESGSATAPVSTAPQKTSASPRPMAATPLGTWTARVLLGVAGLGFVVGFFLPWFTIGGSASMSGLGLLVTQGELVELVTGPYRFLLFSVPMLGAGLLVGALAGHRITIWIALAAGVLVIGGGVYTLIRLFLSTTGFGMWVVVASALLSLAVGLLTLGRRSR